jgi:hypothetical protein
VLAVWLVIGGCAWFLVSFARREGGAADAEALYDAWFGARPAGLSVGAARESSDGSVVLQMSFARAGITAHAEIDGPTTAEAGVGVGRGAGVGAEAGVGAGAGLATAPGSAAGANSPRLPTQLTLVVYRDAQDLLAAFTGFNPFEQKLPEDLAAEQAKLAAGEKDDASAGGGQQFSFGGAANPWREIERGDLSFGAWTSAYLRLRRVQKDEPDRDQVRLNWSDSRRYAVLLVDWEPGVASTLEPLEAFLAEFEPRIQVSDEQGSAR